jgi:hypothetical protein
VIELTQRPDFRSQAVGWETRGREVGPGLVVASGCTSGRPGYCVTPSTKVQLVVKAASVVSVRFTLKQFVLSVVNTDPAFGDVEDHGRQQLGLDPILCGKRWGADNRCRALYEYGTKVVLDAQWDPTQTLTVHWDGCDTPAAGSPPTNDQLCPVTMIRARTVTILWR